MAEQPKKMVPSIRFKGFFDEWDDKPIGEGLTEIKRPIELEDNKLYELVTVRRRNGGVVSRGYLHGKDILVKNYSQLRAGDYVISKRQVVHGATGIIPQYLDKAIVSNEYLVAVGNNNISSEFLTIISILPDMYRKFFLSSYGVDIEKLFFDVADWKKRNVVIPKLTEQHKICSYFAELDQIIQLHQKEHEKLSMLKKAMLNKMFPQNGAATPAIRFKGFFEPWKEKKLGNIGETYSGLSGKCKIDFGHGEGRFVTYMNVFSNTISDPKMTENVEIDNSQNEVKFGDVFFTISSETPDEVGMSSVWASNVSDVYLNSFCFGFRPFIKVNIYYFAYMLRSNDFRRKVSFLAQGISRYNISKNKVLDISVSIPSLDEQHKIGTYFRQLDELIAQHGTQVARLKQIKTACLENMFVRTTDCRRNEQL